MSNVPVILACVGLMGVVAQAVIADAPERPSPAPGNAAIRHEVPDEFESPQFNVPVRTYDASLGTLPNTQGWVEAGFNGDDQVIGGVLHLNASSSTAAAIGGPIAYDWATGLRFSMRVRVPVGVVAVTFLGPGYRGGATIVGVDSLGHAYYVIVGATTVVFSSQDNANPSAELTKVIAFDGASEFHTYAIVSDAMGATLEIDGIPYAQVPVGNVNFLNAQAVTWNIDARAFPVESEWKHVRFGQNIACPADLNGDGVLNLDDVDAFVSSFLTGCTQ